MFWKTFWDKYNTKGKYGITAQTIVILASMYNILTLLLLAMDRYRLHHFLNRSQFV